ncbi:uncharacterized protein LOC124148786 [Haliotis rufescens]|uniref:uncharacterized protein LOC124148786 n=1 Tax=Haliotis rufescens TaxID=6454 RepID=UPI00201EE0B8|nr:uncharacterized protein LOC124148786 [Haliotis rufescens]
MDVNKTDSAVIMAYHSISIVSQVLITSSSIIANMDTPPSTPSSSQTSYPTVMGRLDGIQRSLDSLERRFPKDPASFSSTPVGRKTNLRKCQSVIRRVMEILQTEKDSPLVVEYLDYNSDSVTVARDRVIGEVLKNHSEKEWANMDTLRAAFKNIWINKKDDYTRSITGKKADHRRAARRNKRRTAKLKSRQNSLDQCPKPAAWKERVQEVLTRECTSPDVSDDDQPGMRWVHEIQWESTQMVDIKKYLDERTEAALKHVRRPPKAKLEYDPTRSCEEPMPKKLPSWAIRSTHVRDALLESSPSQPTPNRTSEQ